MNSPSFHESPDPDPVLDELFAVRDMAPPDFVTRTTNAVRNAETRRSRRRRFAAWTGAIAASIALFFGFTIRMSTPGAEMAELAPEEPPKVASVAPETASRAAPSTGDELTALLHAALARENDAMFYGHAEEVEMLLEDAVALTDDESLHTLDMLILIADN